MRAYVRTEEKVTQARAMAGEGKSLREIAIAFGISKSTARQWVDVPYYESIKAGALIKTDADLEHSRHMARLRYKNLTDEQRRARYRNARARYAAKNDPMEAYLAAVESIDDEPLAQRQLADKLKLAVLSYAGLLFKSNWRLMGALTGMSFDQFSDFYSRPNYRIVFKVPLERFDLTDVEHLVRAMHPSNIAMVPEETFGLSGFPVPADLDVLSLKWVETEEALLEGCRFITRTLRGLERRAESIANREAIPGLPEPVDA